MRPVNQLITILRSSPLVLAVACGPSSQRNAEENVKPKIEEISKAPQPTTYKERLDEQVAFLLNMNNDATNLEASKKSIRRTYEDYVVPGLFQNAEARPLKNYIFHLKDTKLDLEEARYLIPTILDLPKFRALKSADQRYLTVLNFAKLKDGLADTTNQSSRSLEEVNEIAFVVRMPELTNKQKFKIREAINPFASDASFSDMDDFEHWFKDPVETDGVRAIRRKIPSKAIHLIDYPLGAETRSEVKEKNLRLNHKADTKLSVPPSLETFREGYDGIKFAPSQDFELDALDVIE